MANRDQTQSQEWVDFDKLRRSIVQQNKIVHSRWSGKEFDPHKYFGGWDQLQRSSLEMVKLGDQFKDMMEYETSNASAMSKSFSNSVISESLAAPSVADELEPTPTVHK